MRPAETGEYSWQRNLSSTDEILTTVWPVPGRDTGHVLRPLPLGQAGPAWGRPVLLAYCSVLLSDSASPPSATASAVTGPDRAAISDSVRPEALRRRWLW